MSKFVVRAAELVGAYGVARTTPDNVDAETIAMARCEMVNQELVLFVQFCYRKGDNGRLVHLRSNSQNPQRRLGAVGEFRQVGLDSD